MFSASSRYANLPDLEMTDERGHRVTYKARRFLPQASRLTIQGEIEVHQSDRPDLVAARALQQPLLFWRIADANDAMDPFELTATPNRTLRVPVPQIQEPVPPL